MNQQSESAPAIHLELARDGHHPWPCRPDRDRIPQALELGILLRRRIDGVIKTVVDSRGSGTKPALHALIVYCLDMSFAVLGGDSIASVAHGGSSWAAVAGYSSGRSFCNVLVDGPRGSGIRREVEPDDIAGRSAVLVDNWLRTGASLERAAGILKRHGTHVVGVVVISAPTDYVSITSPHLHRCPVRVMWPMDMLLREEAAIDD